ncbi:nucleotidyltransferase domain-containing protein [Chromatiaceae bacterium AAb-1]|nr:nucleotidyltransferase domain-containing protein [Chromatiaceae bacterium AAb-1]
MQQSAALHSIISLAKANSEIAALWLYGSRARGNATTISDYDLAVLFNEYQEDALEKRLAPELLAMDWQQQLQSISLSIIDVQQVALPLAYTVISDNTLLFCRNDFARLEFERRVMSKWELDHLYHKAHYA